MHHKVLSSWEGIMQEVSDYMIVVCNADVWVWLKALLAVHTMNFPLSILENHSLFSSSEYYVVSCLGPQIFSFCKSSQIRIGQIPEESLGERMKRKGGKEGKRAGGRGLWPWQDCDKWGRTRQQQQSARTFMNCYAGHLQLWGTERMEKSIFFASTVYTSFWPQFCPFLWPHPAGHTSSSASFDLLFCKIQPHGISKFQGMQDQTPISLLEIKSFFNWS